MRTLTLEQFLRIWKSGPYVVDTADHVVHLMQGDKSPEHYSALCLHPDMSMWYLKLPAFEWHMHYKSLVALLQKEHALVKAEIVFPESTLVFFPLDKPPSQLPRSMTDIVKASKCHLICKAYVQQQKLLLQVKVAQVLALEDPVPLVDVHHGPPAHAAPKTVTLNAVNAEQRHSNSHAMSNRVSMAAPAHYQEHLDASGPDGHQDPSKKGQKGLFSSLRLARVKDFIKHS